jgi:cyanophycin synthetase
MHVIVEHIALEIQSLAGMETGFEEHEKPKHQTYNVVFSYTEENVGMFVAESSVAIAEALIAGTDYDVEADIQKCEIASSSGPSTGSVLLKKQ